MIETPTILILGAGASYPYGFPLGRKLVEDILELFPQSNHSDDRIRSANSHFDIMLGNLDIDISLMNRFSRNLRDSKIDSIDSFLENKDNSEFLAIGKMSILYTLHNYEHSNILRLDNWYRILWNALYVDTKSKDGFKLNKVSIITYNYDRSLEYYLLSCIKSSYGLDDREAYVLLSSTIKIVHIHGKIGVFNIENQVAKTPINMFNTLDYGVKIVDKDKLKLLSNNIKIIHDENINESDELKEANEILMSTERICFLGFSYATDNMSRLKIDNREGKKVICGSAFDMTDLEIERIRSKNPKLLSPFARTENHIFNKNAKCDEFLKHHFIL